MADTNTTLDQVSSMVPDSELGPNRDDKDHRYNTMLKVAPKLYQIVEHLQLVERAMAAMLPEVIAEQPLGATVDLVSDISKTFESVDAALSDIKKRIDFAKEVSLPQRFDDEQVKTFNTDKFRVTKTSRVFASILPEVKDEAFQWLEENEFGSLIKPTVNASSLSAAAKELMENGKELPEDYFRCHMKNGVSITVLKPKRG
jgi:hypothetical protein